MGKYTRKNLKPEDFEKIKLLQKAGLGPKIIRQVTGRSATTISTLFRFDTFKDYQHYNRKRLAESKTAPASKDPQPDTPTALVSVEDITLILQKLNNIEVAVNQLLEAEDARHTHAKVNRWKFGG